MAYEFGLNDRILHESSGFTAFMPKLSFEYGSAVTCLEFSRQRRQAGELPRATYPRRYDPRLTREKTPCRGCIPSPIYNLFCLDKLRACKISSFDP